MAIRFKTSQPKDLLDAFDARISQKESKGKITTWEKSSDGKYYTHKASEWTRKAWLSPKVESGQLSFYIVKPQNINVTSLVYSYYHGHLIETFLNHFDTLFSEGLATALATAGDLCS